MLLEKEYVATNTSTSSREEQEHNALISERYNQLKNALANQFLDDTEQREQANAQATVAASIASVYRSAFDFSSVLEQRPTVTEYVQQNTYSAPTFTAEVNTLPKQETASVSKESYSLSTFAKAAMAVFAVTVVAMVTLIGVNTHTIQQKEMRLQQLQEEQAELVEKGQEIQRRIEAAKSEETIRAYAESQGMISPNP